MYRALARPFSTADWLNQPSRWPLNEPLGPDEAAIYYQVQPTFTRITSLPLSGPDAAIHCQVQPTFTRITSLPLSGPEPAIPYNVQLTALRVTSFLGSHMGVAALYLGPTVWSGITGDANLAMLVSQISSEYASKLCRRTKTYVLVGNRIPYRVPSGGAISTCSTVTEETPILIGNLRAAEQLAYYGKAELFIFVKRGSFCNRHYAQLLSSMARAVGKGRVARILIICDTPATPAVIQRGRELFNGLDFVYDEIKY